SWSSWSRRLRRSSGGRPGRRRGRRKTPATRQSGAAKAEPARREEEDAARAVGVPSPLGGRSHPGSAGTEATAIAWPVAADHRHRHARGIYLGVGCVAGLAPAPDIPATVTNEIDLSSNGRWRMGRRLVPFVSITFLSCLIACSPQRTAEPARPPR